MTATVLKIPPRRERLECSNCGASTEAPCDCGALFLPAGMRAEQALAENPALSDRVIADAIGVSEPTVSKARKQSTDKSLSVEKHIGRDGKARRLPKKMTKAQARAKALQAAETMDQPEADPKVQSFLREVSDFIADFSWRLNEWHDTDPVIDHEARYALVHCLTNYSMELQRLAQKIDGRE